MDFFENVLLLKSTDFNLRILFQPAVRFDTSDSSSLAPPGGASRKPLARNGNASSRDSSPAVSPVTPRRKPKKLTKLKSMKGNNKLLKKFKLAAQKVNKAQEYIEKTR